MYYIKFNTPKTSSAYATSTNYIIRCTQCSQMHWMTSAGPLQSKPLLCLTSDQCSYCRRREQEVIDLVGRLIRYERLKKVTMFVGVNFLAYVSP